MGSLRRSANCSLQALSGPLPVPYDLHTQNGLHSFEELKKIEKDFVIHEIQISGPITLLFYQNTTTFTHILPMAALAPLKLRRLRA